MSCTQQCLYFLKLCVAYLKFQTYPFNPYALWVRGLCCRVTGYMIWFAFSVSSFSFSHHIHFTWSTSNQVCLHVLVPSHPCHYFSMVFFLCDFNPNLLFLFVITYIWFISQSWDQSPRPTSCCFSVSWPV